jgi:hypothetical protein
LWNTFRAGLPEFFLDDVEDVSLMESRKEDEEKSYERSRWQAMTRGAILVHLVQIPRGIREVWKYRAISENARPKQQNATTTPNGNAIF